MIIEYLKTNDILKYFNVMKKLMDIKEVNKIY